ncbi:MAG: peptidase M14 [Planctomycetota bacterium]|nr:MAG: peptidase M14 [Planctomycetota bacterium]
MLGRRWMLCCVLAAAGCSEPQVRPLPPPPLTIPERTQYMATSSHADVLAFLDALAAAGDPRVVRSSFGTTPEGRDQPLMIVADPPLHSAAEARKSGRIRVFVMANIHAGEVEGKEACLELLRDLVYNDGRPPYPLEKVVFLCAPIYNADGNERVGPKNRPLQNGPRAMGVRETAKGLDLNRDYLKLENLETRSLVRLLNEWDPHVVVDLHTTNGSAHGYELTYAPALTPSAHPLLLGASERDWLPTLRKRMRERHGFETFDYGNFIPADQSDWFTDDPQRSVRGWETFDHRPRFGNNYVGLRNRIAILSEAYSYADFQTRIAATKAFVLEILRLAAERGEQTLRLLQRLDNDTAVLAGNGQLVQATSVHLVDRGGPEELLLRGFETVQDPATGAECRVASGPRTAIQVPCFVKYAPAGTRTAPRAYLLPPDQAGIIDLVRAHGIRVDVLEHEQACPVEVHRVRAARAAERAFQGHRGRSVDWELRTEERRFPVGSFHVPMNQPLARLVFHVLDPQADDGLVHWNFFDAVLDRGTGAEVPVYGLR